MKSPAFQFYPDDFMGGKAGMMTPDEVGVYTLLLCLDWNQNGFVFRPNLLARWCRTSTRKFMKAWASVSENFVEHDGRMYNPRLEIERRKQARWREKSSEGGRKGAATRASRVVQPKGNIPFPSPSPVQEPPNPLVAADAAPPRGGKKPLTPSPEEAAVLAHYVETHPRRRPGDKELKAVRRALGFGYSVDDLKAAITGNATDEWHREKKKHELGYVLRDNGKIDDFRARAESADNGPLVDEFGLLTARGLRVAGLVS